MRKKSVAGSPGSNTICPSVKFNMREPASPDLRNSKIVPPFLINSVTTSPLVWIPRFASERSGWKSGIARYERINRKSSISTILTVKPASVARHRHYISGAIIGMDRVYELPDMLQRVTPRMPMNLSKITREIDLSIGDMQFTADVASMRRDGLRRKVLQFRDLLYRQSSFNVGANAKLRRRQALHGAAQAHRRTAK